MTDAQTTGGTLPLASVVRLSACSPVASSRHGTGSDYEWLVVGAGFAGSV